MTAASTSRQTVTPTCDNGVAIMLEELADDFLREHRINGRKSEEDAEAHWGLHLKSFFGALGAREISSSLLTQYIEFRQKEGAQNATVNRELASLECMFTLGLKHGKVRELPVFPRLKEETVPQGYVEDGRYQKLVDYSPHLGGVAQPERASTRRAKDHD